MDHGAPFGWLSSTGRRLFFPLTESTVKVKHEQNTVSFATSAERSTDGPSQRARCEGLTTLVTYVEEIVDGECVLRVHGTAGTGIK
jgi:hypothetical protein